MRFIFDSHLDLGWCATSFNRDLTQTVEEIRKRETGMTDERSRGRNTLTLPELRKAGIGVCVATLLARSGPEPKWQAMNKRTDLDSSSQSIAYAQAHGQLAYYRLLEAQGHMKQLRTGSDLKAHWQAYTTDPQHTPLGFILSMEGADPVIEPSQIGEWWDCGLRAIGPAHYGRSHYAYGTAVDGPLGDRGRDLLKAMRDAGLILDVTHLSDISFWEAVDLWDGPMLASHHNCRALVPGDRQLTDDQLKLLISRGSVIGAALDAWMLYPNWVRGETKPTVITLEAVADHMDRICQLAGNANHSAIGSDLDGGFGNEQTPGDMDTITDLQKLNAILARRGYSEADIDAIFHNNWLRFFSAALPSK
ncbi:MAG: membrane dipeptidase [Phycisphaeraceae bacterium]